MAFVSWFKLSLIKLRFDAISTENKVHFTWACEIISRLLHDILNQASLLAFSLGSFYIKVNCSQVCVVVDYIKVCITGRGYEFIIANYSELDCRLITLKVYILIILLI